LSNRLLRGAFIWRSAAAGCGEQALGEGFWRLVAECRIFLLFSKVIVDGLLSAILAVWAEMALQPPILSKAID